MFTSTGCLIRAHFPRSLKPLGPYKSGLEELGSPSGRCCCDAGFRYNTSSTRGSECYPCTEAERGRTTEIRTVGRAPPTRPASTLSEMGRHLMVCHLMVCHLVVRHQMAHPKKTPRRTAPGRTSCRGGREGAEAARGRGRPREARAEHPGAALPDVARLAHVQPRPATLFCCLLYTSPSPRD